MNKRALSESDICDRFITPALYQAGWLKERILREHSFTDGRIIVRGRLVSRGRRKRADYLLVHEGVPLAVIEAKDNTHALGDGMQQALAYADALGVPHLPFVFSSNGDGFLLHDRTGQSEAIETVLGRVETSQAWRVSIETIRERHYNLDLKNPHTVAEDHGDPEELLADLQEAERQTAELRDQLKAILAEALLR